MNIETRHLKEIYRIALRIRLVEKRIASEYARFEMRCPVHLSIGQELVSAIVGINQLNSDTAVGTHRAHAHYLAKGGNLYRMVAEIYGKVTGCSKGRGGSMHLIDLDIGFLGSSAIVGNSIPIGVGSGLAHRLDGRQALSFVFFGDGATEEGAFFESINFAAVKELPVVFVCENNLYSVYTGLGPRQPQARDISRMVASMGIPSHRIDVAKPVSAYQQVNELVRTSREKGKPLFLEFPTYRWLEHCGPNDDDVLAYRPKGELKKWQEDDSLAKLGKVLVSEFQVDFEELRMLERKICDEIDAVFEAVKSDRFPTLEESLGGAYA